MNKHFNFFFAQLLIASLSGAAWAQTGACARPTAQLPFEGNQVRYTLKVGDAIPFNAAPGTAAYFPDSSFTNVATLFAAQLWLGAIDDSGDRKSVV